MFENLFDPKNDGVWEEWVDTWRSDEELAELCQNKKVKTDIRRRALFNLVAPYRIQQKDFSGCGYRPCICQPLGQCLTSDDLVEFCWGVLPALLEDAKGIDSHGRKNDFYGYAKLATVLLLKATPRRCETITALIISAVKFLVEQDDSLNAFGLVDCMFTGQAVLVVKSAFDGEIRRFVQTERLNGAVWRNKGERRGIDPLGRYIESVAHSQFRSDNSREGYRFDRELYVQQLAFILEQPRLEELFSNYRRVLHMVRPLTKMECELAGTLIRTILTNGKEALPTRSWGEHEQGDIKAALAIISEGAPSEGERELCGRLQVIATEGKKQIATSRAAEREQEQNRARYEQELLASMLK